MTESRLVETKRFSGIVPWLPLALQSRYRAAKEASIASQVPDNAHLNYSGTVGNVTGLCSRVKVGRNSDSEAGQYVLKASDRALHEPTDRVRSGAQAGLMGLVGERRELVILSNAPAHPATPRLLKLENDPSVLLQGHSDPVKTN